MSEISTVCGTIEQFALLKQKTKRDFIYRYKMTSINTKESGIMSAQVPTVTLTGDEKTAL